MTATQELRGLASIIPTSDPSALPLERQSILLYGQPKIGKTTLASKFKNALFLDGEAGTLNLSVPTFETLIHKDRVRDPIRRWEDVLKATKVLSGIKDAEGVIVIDPVQEFYTMARDYTLRKNGWDHETDGAYGKGWRAVNDEFASWIRMIKVLPYGIVFIAHETEIDIETATEKYQKAVPRMDKGCKTIIEPLVNQIWYAHTKHFRGIGEVRVIQTKGTKHAMAGERGDPPRLPLYVPMEYEDLVAAWNGEKKEITEETTS